MLEEHVNVAGNISYIIYVEQENANNSQCRHKKEC